MASSSSSAWAAVWKTILEVGQAPTDSPIRQVIALLDQIEAGVNERFRVRWNSSGPASPRR
jgi:hypothetical protein